MWAAMNMATNVTLRAQGLNVCFYVAMEQFESYSGMVFHCIQLDSRTYDCIVGLVLLVLF